MSIKVMTYNPAPTAADRPPEAARDATASGGSGEFQDTMNRVQTARSNAGRLPSVPLPMRKPTVPLVLDNGQSAPPLPDPKPVQLANGQSTPPVPGEKPMVLANGQATPPVPGQKPGLSDGQDGSDAQAIAAVMPGRKPAVPPISTAQADADRITLASRQVAGLSGHSFAAILAQATQESGLNPGMKNTASTAAGPFQFLERTWLGLFQRYGAAYGQSELASKISVKNGIPRVDDPAVRKQILDLRHDVDLSAGMAARYLSEGRERLSRNLKRPVTETESRIAYVLGVGGAAQLLRAAQSSPNAVAAELLPKAAEANRGLFYDRASGRALTAAETVSRLARRMDSDHSDMFSAISRADEQRQRLDGTPSPFAAFQSAQAGDETGAGGGDALA